MQENEALDLIELEDDDSRVTLWQEENSLFYNGEQYAILHQWREDASQDVQDTPVCVMKVVPFTDEDGEEMEELISVQDEKLAQRVLEIASLQLSSEEEDEEV